MPHDVVNALRNAAVSQLELRRAHNDVLGIQKFLPLCAFCRQVRIED